MTVSDLFHAGKLQEAIAGQLEEVRNHPSDAGRRLLLVELLCFSGAFERADTQLDALGQLDAKTMPWVVTFRHLIRAAQARDDFYVQGRLPEFLGRPEGSTRTLLEAAVLLREGAEKEAAARLDEAEAARVKVHGRWDDRIFDDFRDLDDRTASVLEVLTTQGQYYWIPFERIELLEARPPGRPRDLLWRPVHLVVRDGPDGEVFLPVLYPGSGAETDEALRLGRSTDWRGGEGSPVRGAGQRTFLIGEEAVPILDLTTVTFEASTTSA
jgi:type VI secretion system protein ImpE